jgi:hypothetical protein
VRGTNSETVEPSKRGSRRVKSPKSKSPAPPIPAPASASTSFLAPENDDAREVVLQLKGHEAEVSEHGALNPVTNCDSIRSSFVLGTPLNTIY